jgi:hypothetical protein
MTTLLALQQSFQDALLHSATDALLAWINPHCRLSPAAQFQLYQHSVLGGLQKALKRIYPVSCQLVGAKFFAGMADAYIRLTPSQSCDLNQYGESFAQFIAAFPPAASLGYLPDVARLEWAWHQIYFANNAAPFKFQQLATQMTGSIDQLFFLLPHQSSLLDSPYPIQTIWEQNREPNPDTLINLVDNETYYCFVWRQKLTMRIDSLTAIEWQILTWIQQQLPLPQLCTKTNELFPELPIATVLSEWVERGWITGFTNRD